MNRISGIREEQKEEAKHEKNRFVGEGYGRIRMCRDTFEIYFLLSSRTCVVWDLKTELMFYLL